MRWAKLYRETELEERVRNGSLNRFPRAGLCENLMTGATANGAEGPENQYGR